MPPLEVIRKKAEVRWFQVESKVYRRQVVILKPGCFQAGRVELACTSAPTQVVEVHGGAVLRLDLGREGGGV